jgi:hypothetical protein
MAAAALRLSASPAYPEPCARRARPLAAAQRHHRRGDEPSRHTAEDVIERLYAAGLIHRIGQFVFATRAAHAADYVSA